jgi:hypothetical protein
MDWPGSLRVFEIAAFWTSTSRRPNSLRTRSAAAEIDARFVTSSWSARASGPTSLAAASPRSARWLQRMQPLSEPNAGWRRLCIRETQLSTRCLRTLISDSNPHSGGFLSRRGAAGEVRTDVAAEGLLGAVAGLCMQAYNKGPEYASRMVALLVDGLRYGAKSAKSKLS